MCHLINQYIDMHKNHALHFGRILFNSESILQNWRKYSVTIRNDMIIFAYILDHYGLLLKN